MSNFIHRGDSIDHTPAAAVAAGEVVIVGNLIGVATHSIAAGILGAIALVGVFAFDKSGSTGPVFAVGDEVHWDAVNELAVHAAAGTYPLGICTEAAGASDTSVRARLVQQAPPTSGLIREAVDLTSASKTLDAQDIGKALVVTGSGTYVVTLPSTAAGLIFTVIAAADGARVALSPAAADKIMGADLAGVDNKDRILTAATARKGDYIVLQGDGVDGWRVVAERGTWAAEA